MSTDLPLDSLLLRASVSGPFDPVALLQGLDPIAARARAAELASFCEEAPDGTGRHWVLMPAVRRAQLARIDSPAVVQLALEDAPAPADPVTSLLRRLLEGRPLPRLKPNDLPARDAALQLAEAAPIVDRERLKRDRAATDAALARMSLARGIDGALPGRLYGRAGELRRIRALLDEPGREVKPALVTGQPGIGKSALIARLVRDWRQTGAAVVIDFDSPRFGVGRPIPIFVEMLRQLEFYARTMKDGGHSADFVHLARRRLRDIEMSLGERASLDEMAEPLGTLLLGVLIGPQSNWPEICRVPILLVFDSFEAAARGGAAFVARLLELEDEYRRLGPFDHLRTVVSCRQPPLSPQDFARFVGENRRLNTRGIAPKAGSRLLKSRDEGGRFPDDQLRRRASSALKGNPLALIVLERFARKRSLEDVERLIEDLEGNAEFNAEFAQSFLYTRILDRIDDPDVARLAHPGLVLRDLDADMIRLVLAEPCGLGEIGPERADELFRALEAEYWLVESDGDRLRHRPDLRRIMLPALFAGPRESDSPEEKSRKTDLLERARAVCRSAALYFGEPSTNERSLTADQRSIEASYYRALAGEAAPAELTPDRAGALAGHLGEDLETLPPAWRAAIKASAGQFDMLTEQERATLTGRLAREARVERAERAAITESADISRKPVYFAATGRAAGTSFAQAVGRALDLREMEVVVRDAFQKGDWRKCADAGADLLEQFVVGNVTSTTLQQIEQGRGWATPVWMAVLAHQVRCVGPGKLFGLAPRPATRSPRGEPTVFAAAAQLLLNEFLPSVRELVESARVSKSLFGLRILAFLARRAEPDQFPGGAIASTTLSLADVRVTDFLLSRSTGRVPGRRLGRLAELVRQSGRWTGADLASIYDDKGTIRLQYEDLHAYAQTPNRVLRGLTPELHQSAADLLSTLPGPLQEGLNYRLRSWSERWSESIDRLRSPWWETRPGYQRRYLSVVIAADRHGQFGPLLKWLAENHSEAQPLLDIYRAIDERIFGLTDL